MKYTNFKRLFVLNLILTLGFSSPLFAQQYYKVSEILTHFYPNSMKISYEQHNISEKQAKSISDKIQFPGTKTNWTIYVAKSVKTIDGYVIVDNIIGKEQPITFAVNISPTGEVREIEILVYRESHGGQVKNKSYRKQFIGKSVNDPLSTKQDIQHISGATISSDHIAKGVKRALLVWNEIFKNKQN